MYLDLNKRRPTKFIFTISTCKHVRSGTNTGDGEAGCASHQIISAKCTGSRVWSPCYLDWVMRESGGEGGSGGAERRGRGLS